MAPALKDALLAAFVTFVLLAPMLGMRTASGPTGMTLEFHFEWVFLFTALVFAGRLALSLARRRRERRSPCPAGS